MATLIAIGYRDETSATAASEEALRRARDLVVEPDEVAVVRRDGQGEFHVTTNHRDLETGAAWGVFWRLLLGVLFSVPAAGDGTDGWFRSQVRDLVEPRTSALFLVLKDVPPDAAIDALGRYGGTVLTSSISETPASPARVPGPADAGVSAQVQAELA